MKNLIIIFAFIFTVSFTAYTENNEKSSITDNTNTSFNNKDNTKISETNLLPLTQNEEKLYLKIVDICLSEINGRPMSKFKSDNGLIWLAIATENKKAIYYKFTSDFSFLKIKKEITNTNEMNRLNKLAISNRKN